MYYRDILVDFYVRAIGVSVDYARNVVQPSQINDYERIYNEKED